MNLKFTNPEILLTAEPYKDFSYGGVFFNYPNFYTFQADLDKPNVSLWTLSGKKAVIMIQSFELQIEHKNYIKILRKQHGRIRCKVLDCEMNINNKVLNGSKVIVKSSGVFISQKVFSFDTKKGTIIIILQDTLSDNEPSQEGLELEKLIELTFTLSG